MANAALTQAQGSLADTSHPRNAGVATTAANVHSTQVVIIDNLLRNRIDQFFDRAPEKVEMDPEVGGVSIIRRRERGVRAESIALDAYLAEHFDPVIDLAIEQRDLPTLRELASLWTHVSPCNPDQKTERFRLELILPDEPVNVAGEYLIRLILNRSAEHGMSEVFNESLRRMLGDIRLVIRSLPKGDETEYIRFHWLTEEEREGLSDEARPDDDRLENSRRSNEDKVEGFVQSYIDYIEFLCRRIIDSSTSSSYFNISFSLIRIVHEAVEEGVDRIIRNELLSSVIRSLNSLLDYSIEASRKSSNLVEIDRIINLHGLETIVEKLDPDVDAVIFGVIARNFGQMIEGQWRDRMLGRSLVEDISRIYRRTEGKFIEHQLRFIDLLDRIAREIGADGRSEGQFERQVIYDSCVDGIRRQQPSDSSVWGDPAVKELIAKIRTVLRALQDDGLPTSSTAPSKLSPVPIAEPPIRAQSEPTEVKQRASPSIQGKHDRALSLLQWAVNQAQALRRSLTKVRMLDDRVRRGRTSGAD